MITAVSTASQFPRDPVSLVSRANPTDFIKSSGRFGADSLSPRIKFRLGEAMSNQVKVVFTEQLKVAQLALDNLWRLNERDLPSVLEASPRWQNANASEVALAIFNSRRARAKHFGNRNIFGEPAWDILLDLYIHQAEGKQISIKSASIGSCAPATTALRWLKILEEEALVVSVEDPTDQRRRFVQLSAEGYEVMTRYFHDIAG